MTSVVDTAIGATSNGGAEVAEPQPAVIVSMAPLLADRVLAARLLGISVKTFDRLRVTGRIGPQPIRLGSKVLWRVDELRRWIKAGCPNADRWRQIERERDEP